MTAISAMLAIGSEMIQWLKSLSASPAVWCVFFDNIAFPYHIQYTTDQRN
jgi:hypothetical protein